MALESETATRIAIKLMKSGHGSNKKKAMDCHESTNPSEWIKVGRGQ
jgi:hypothetical protein